MKYALHARCQKNFLKKADDIIVDYKEKERILDYPEEYPDTAVTIQFYNVPIEEIDWIWLQNMAPMFPKGFTLGFVDMLSLRMALDLKLKAYLLKHINNFAELSMLKEIGVCFVYLDQPLFSSIDKIKKYELPVRWTPNLVDSTPGYLQRLQHGSWIRPEDIDMYNINDGCICEFISSNGYAGEQAYFKIYTKKMWPQDFGYIYPEFENLNINNFLLTSKLTEIRLNCHQRCEETPGGAGCHVCDLEFFMANNDRLHKVEKSLKDGIKLRKESLKSQSQD